TKAAAWFRLEIPAGGDVALHLRLFAEGEAPAASPGATFGRGFDEVFQTRIREADEFFRSVTPGRLSEEEQTVQRQAYAGLMWTKQFYHYDVTAWLEGDPAQPPPAESR